MIGVIAENALLRPLISGAIRPSDPVESLIDKNYSVVEAGDSIDRLNELFSNGKVVLVTEGGKNRYILTPIDLISFLSAQVGV